MTVIHKLAETFPQFLIVLYPTPNFEQVCYYLSTKQPATEKPPELYSIASTIKSVTQVYSEGTLVESRM